MSKISRRKLITTGLLATAGATDSERLRNSPSGYGLIPPDAGVLYGAGETLTYAAQRLLTRHSLAPAFARSQISQDPFAKRSLSLGRRVPPLTRGRVCGLAPSGRWNGCEGQHRSRWLSSGTSPVAPKSR